MSVDGTDWVGSPGGVRCRAPYGANKDRRDWTVDKQTKMRWRMFSGVARLSCRENESSCRWREGKQVVIMRLQGMSGMPTTSAEECSSAYIQFSSAAL